MGSFFEEVLLACGRLQWSEKPLSSNFCNIYSTSSTFSRIFFTTSHILYLKFL